MREIRHRYIDGFSTILNCRIAHISSPLVVLLHGMWLNHHSWNEVMRHLSNKGILAIAPDLQSRCQVSEMTIADYQREMESFLEIMMRVVRRDVVAVGQSLAGANLQVLAQSSPWLFRGIVPLASTSPKGIGGAGAFFQAFPKYLPQAVSYGVAKYTDDELPAVELRNEEIQDIFIPHVPAEDRSDVIDSCFRPDAWPTVFGIMGKLFSNALAVNFARVASQTQMHFIITLDDTGVPPAAQLETYHRYQEIGSADQLSIKKIEAPHAGHLGASAASVAEGIEEAVEKMVSERVRMF